MASKKNQFEGMSGTKLAWVIVGAIILFFAWVAIAAWGIEMSWNNLTLVTHLPQISWSDGLNAVVLGYFISQVLGLRRGKAND